MAHRSVCRPGQDGNAPLTLLGHPRCCRQRQISRVATKAQRTTANPWACAGTIVQPKGGLRIPSSFERGFGAEICRAGAKDEGRRTARKRFMPTRGEEIYSCLNAFTGIAGCTGPAVPQSSRTIASLARLVYAGVTSTDLHLREGIPLKKEKAPRLRGAPLPTCVSIIER